MMILLFFSFDIFAQPDVDVFTDSLKKFEQRCFDENGNAVTDSVIQEDLYSCEQEHKYLTEEFNNRESLMTQHPDVHKMYTECVANKNVAKVTPFAEQIEDIAEEVSCIKEEKKDCAEAWKCNNYRTVLDIADVLPDVIEKPIHNFFENQAKAQGYSSDCLRDGKSNCMEDFFNALMDSLWSTATSIKDLAAATGRKALSLFGLDDYFSSQANKNLVAAKQSVKKVESFLDSPGKWLSNFMTDLKEGVDHWIKSSVFCQEWKYNSELKDGEFEGVRGVARTCVKPLEDFGCVDCDDMIDATCIAIGGLTAEVGVAFFTAGIGTAASFGARASAKALMAASSKVTAKINTRIPKFAKPKKVKKKSKLVTQVGVVATKSVEVAKKIMTVSTAAAKNSKAKLDAFTLAVKNNKVVATTAKVIDVVNVPGKMLNNASRMGTAVAAKTVAKKGSGTMAKHARVVVSAVEKEKRSTKAHRIYKKKSSAKKNRVIQTNKIAKKGKRSKAAKEHHAKSEAKREKEQKELADKHHKEKEKQQLAEKHHKEKEQKEFVEKKKKEKEQKELAEKHKKEKEQKELAEKHKKEKEQKELAEKHKKEKEQKELAEKRRKQEEHEMKMKLAAAGVAADLAAKGVNISRREANREMKRLKDAKKKELEDLKIKSMNDAKAALGIENQNIKSEAAKLQAESLKEMYSDKNTESVVSAIEKANPGMDRRNAKKVYENRKTQVDSAYDMINRNQASSASRNLATKRSQRRNLEAELESVKKQGELETLSSELESIKAEREEIESGKSSSKSVARDASKNISATEASSVEASRVSAGSSRGSRRAVSSRSRAPSSVAGASVSRSSPTSSDSYEQMTSEQDVLAENNGESEIDSLEDIEKGIDGEVISEDKEDRRGKAKSLKELLGLISKNGIQIKKNVKFDRDLSLITSSSYRAKVKLEKLKSLVTTKQKADKLVTYKTETGKLEVYHFDKEQYPLSIGDDGKTELIDDTTSRLLINSVGQVD